MCVCDRRNCKIQHLSTRSCAERLSGRRKCCEKLSESSTSLKRFVDKGLRFQNIRHCLLKQSLDVFDVFQGRLKAENLKQHLCHQMANHEVPDISEYLEARIKCKKLQQDIHTWERKVRIAQVYFTSSDPIREPQPRFGYFVPLQLGML